MSVKAYVYVVRNIETKEFYYGYRSANIRHGRDPKEDFWTHYKTSSKNLKAQITKSPEQFTWEIVFEGSPEECYWIEQALIKQHFKCHGCLNRHYAEPGSIQFWKASPGAQKGIPKSKEHRERIRQAKLGVPSTISTVAKERRGIAISESNRKRKGVPRTPEVKSRLKGSTSGSANSRAKTWTIEQENGEVFTMKGIKPWCVSQGLIQSTLKRTLTTGVFYCGYRVIALN